MTVATRSSTAAQDPIVKLKHRVAASASDSAAQHETAAVKRRTTPSTNSAVLLRLPSFLVRLLFDPTSSLLSIMLLILEAILGIIIIHTVAYTEIDWTTYMQHVDLFTSGVRDYFAISGDTGPCVYPAGYLYVYTLLQALTEHGHNIRSAQYLFLIFYLVMLAFVHAIYRQCRLPPYLLIFLSLSKRIHSIFMLRLFNDGLCMMLLYASLLSLLHRRYSFSSVLFSCALSIKMNILLFAPAFLIILLQSLAVHTVVAQLLLMLGVQLLIGAPFLWHQPMHYLSKAFEFSRVFFYKWTVNLKVLPEPIFLHPYTSLILLLAHVAVLLYFLHRYSGKGGLLNVAKHGVLGLCDNRGPMTSIIVSASNIVSLFFIANFVGVVFARSLHYQFYVWYFHSIPFLLDMLPVSAPAWMQSKWPTSTTGELTMQQLVSILVRALALLLIEVAWNVFPATAWSSGMLICVHLLILSSLLMAKLPIHQMASKA